MWLRRTKDEIEALARCLYIDALTPPDRTAISSVIRRWDEARTQCKAWREEAEAWRAWWPLNVKSDTTERRTATEPNEADIIATDAWDVLEAARARTDALAKKQGDTSCLE